MLPYPEGNRFAVSTGDNRQADLWIASLLSLIYSLVILCTRLVIKWGFFGLDDILLSGAYVLSVAHWALFYHALGRGLGKAPSALGDESVDKIGLLVFTSRIFLLASLGLSKCAVVSLIAHLFTKANHRAWRVCVAGGAITGVWTLLAPLAVSINCHPGKAIATDASAVCPSEIMRWRTVVAVDFVIECMLVALPACLISKVQMNRKKKSMVMLAFAFRIGNALLMLAFLISYMSAFSTEGRASIDVVKPLIWQEALIFYGLMSATVPVLKGFLGSFDTTALLQIDQSHSGTRSYQYGSTMRGPAVGRSTTTSGMDNAHGWKRKDGLRMRPETQTVATSIWHEQQGDDDSSGRAGSEDGIIRRTVQYEIRSSSA